MNYGIRVLVNMSTFVEIKANNKKEAEEKVKELYYSGKLMGNFQDCEYYDGMDIDIESENSL